MFSRKIHEKLTKEGSRRRTHTTHVLVFVIIYYITIYYAFHFLNFLFLSNQIFIFKIKMNRQKQDIFR